MKTSKTNIILFSILLLWRMNPSFMAAQTSRFSFNTYISDKGDSLNYRMLYPDYDTLRRYPLVIFLHGSGERGNYNEAQLKWGVMNFATDQNMILHPAIVVAPQCPAHQEHHASTTIASRTFHAHATCCPTDSSTDENFTCRYQSHLHHRSFHGRLWNL
jgi:poly(3-hydroxybutyrate) depolymerase